MTMETKAMSVPQPVGRGYGETEKPVIDEQPKKSEPGVKGMVSVVLG